MREKLRYVLIILALIGVLDAGYLTFEHYQNIIPPCNANSFFGDCGKVLQSEYAIIFDVPVALLGLIHYSFLTATLVLAVLYKNSRAKILAIILATLGLLMSFYFVLLQLFVIHAICIFCFVSAVICLLLFLLIMIEFKKERQRVSIFFTGLVYKNICKPILFKIDPEVVHQNTTKAAELLGKSHLSKALLQTTYTYKDPALEQEVVGINFQNPIGLSAGFDYEARLTQIIPNIGFGFETVGTITNQFYGGNPRPMLGRLPKSQALMVNKGFKNLGAKQTIEKLSGLSFAIPLGVSIGRTNSRKLATQRQSIEDIVRTFITFEQSKLKHMYYELNISCPNLYGDITFYPSKNLNQLLNEIDKLNIKRPIFIKMPIEKTNAEVLAMLDVIAKHSPKGVIFGNLQKDRSHPTFDAKEVSRFPSGNFSGKPTYVRSNELIQLSYRNFHQRFIIIGSGGVFSAEDAYTKITLGASLVQLITGMIFVGPQLIPDINMQLVDLLKRDGFTHISQAVGTKNM